MSIATRASTDLDGPARSHRGLAFGIDIDAPIPLPIPNQLGGATGGERATRLQLASWRELREAWRPSSPSTVLERRFPDGRLVMSVEYEEGDYCVYAPGNGRHVVSADGCRISSYLPRIAAWRWHRLLFAQVLPLAATLQGLELLHASAVRHERKVLGFVAPAGTGKTSTAAHMVGLGGTLLTDDVLALELSAQGVVAHPGANVLHVDAAELETLPSEARDCLGPSLGGGAKVVLSPPVVEHAMRLHALYFLERPASEGLSISVLPPDPVRLLANSFNGYVRSPERVVNQLAVIGELAESVAMFSVAIPAGVGANDVASAVSAHALVAA